MEGVLEERLASARQLAYEVDRVLGNRAFPHMAQLSGSDFPSLTLRRLQLAATSQFGAGIALLANAWTAYVADVHTRGLLEIMAHVGWIAGITDARATESSRCRALCFERGVADAIEEIETSVAALAPGQLSVESAKHAAQHRKHLDELRAAEGCTCQPRRPGHVRSSLKAMSGGRDRLPNWFPGLYDWLSREVHQQALDRMMFETAMGMVFISSRYSQRVWSLTFLVTAYGQIASWTLTAEGASDAGQRILSTAQRIVDDEWMDQARDGKVDEELGLPPIPS